MEEDAVKYAERILAKYKDEEDRILLLNMIMTRIIKDVNITKVQASGVPELIACKQLGLTWNGETVHGGDAVDKEGRNVELKTYRRVTNSNRINIMYSFPPREAKESNEDYRQRVIKHYRTSSLFDGGHYWVSFDQKKEKVLGYYLVESKTVAEEIGEYLERNPTSKSKNFGGVICPDCHRCHTAEKFAKKTFVSKGQPNIVCSK